MNKNFTTPVLIIIGIFLCFSLNLDAQEASEFRFSRIAKEEGLPHNGINVICEDSLGFLWMGTKDGLARLDGSGQILAIKPGPNNQLKNSNISSLLVDQSNNLWIGTRLGGLTKYNLTKDLWTNYQHDPGNVNSLGNNEILTLMEDHEQNIWIGTEHGLNHLDTKTNKISPIKYSASKENGLQAKAVLDIFQDDKNRIWVGTWAGGLHLLLKKTTNISESKFIHFKPDGIHKTSLNVWKIFQDKNNRIWLGTHGRGLFLLELPEDFDQNLGLLKEQPKFINFLNDNSERPLTSNNIFSLLQDIEGGFWVGTTYGVNYVSPNQMKAKEEIKNLKFQHFKFDAKRSTTISNNTVNDLFQDKQGIIWIATTGGLSKFNSFTNQFKSHDLSDYLFEFPVAQNLLIDVDDLLWIGNNSNIVTYDIRKKEVKLFEDIKPSSQIGSVYSKDQVNLYFGANNGIYAHNKSIHKTEFFPFPDSIQNKFYIKVRNFFEDSQERLWIGTELGLILFNKKDKSFLFIRQEEGNPNSLVDNSITEIMEDSEKTIWISTYNGISKLKSTVDNKLIFESILMDNSDSTNQLPSNQITALEEHGNKIYFGTTVGLACYDLTTKKITNLAIEKDKITVQSLVISNDSLMWIGTNQGLSTFNFTTKLFNHYYKKDGILDNSYNQGSVVKTNSGSLVFGSSSGLTAFNPTKIQTNTTTPKTYISHIKIINDEGEKVINSLYKDKIELDSKDYYISFSLASSNKNRPEKNQFKYKLEGLEEQWFETDRTKDIVYTNLKPGSYFFKVKSSNNDGIWDEKGRSLQIIQNPALWETWWFRLLSILLLLLAIYFILKKYTSEITTRNLSLQETNLRLGNEVRNRKRIEEELTRSNKDLEQFAYIASHDLQEPLRNVDNFVNLIEKKFGDDQDKMTKSYFQITKKSITRMFGLIKSVLTYSLVGKENTQFNEVDLNVMLEEHLFDLRKTIKEKPIKIEITPLPVIRCEEEQLGMVFYNLISNAIKYSSSENCLIKISAEKSKKDKAWQFSVKDNGIGIEKEHLDKIFNIFTRLHNDDKYEGTGIGLAICQKIIERHNGRIWVESEFGEGSTFYFTIPESL